MNRAVFILILFFFVSTFTLAKTAHAQDLVAYYKFDEGSGSVAADSSGNGNSGTLYNSPVWTAGKSGNALQFNGANTYVEAPDSNSLDITNGITLEAWVYPTSLSGWKNVVEKDQQGGYKLGFYNNQVVFTLYYLWDSYSSGTVPLNQWSHIAATYDRQNVKIYINGVLDSTTPNTDQIGLGNSPVDIGWRRTDDSSYFNGKIDEVKIWNRALTAAEIQTEYQGKISIFGRLLDKSNNPIAATVFAGSSGIATSSNGDYTLQISPGNYNINYSTSKLWISLASFGLTSNTKDLINYINSTAAKTYFTIGSDNSQNVQMSSASKPAKVSINGTVMSEVSSLPQLAVNTWYYDSSAKNLYIKTKSYSCSDGTAYGQCSATKPMYCNSGTLVSRCSVCGCSSGSCRSDETCQSTPSDCVSSCVNNGYSSGTCRSGTSTGAGGEIYMWWGVYITAGDANAVRIANAHDVYGLTVWVDTGNDGTPMITTTLINYFHAHGVKIIDRLWSNGGNTPLNTILHDMNVGNGMGSVDYQMSIGPGVDAFMIDECDQSNVAYYQAIADYVHSKGKLIFVNPGGNTLSNTIINMVDKVSTELTWYSFMNSAAGKAQIAANPQKFIGQSNDWGYASEDAPYMPPTSASGDRPAYSPPLSEARAVWDTSTAWSGGVYDMESRPGDTNGNSGEASGLPSWWEDYLSQLSSGATPASCQSSEYSIGQDGCSSGQLCCCSGTATCTPSCAGKSCGDNGCGGSCGTCTSGTCLSDGTCSSTPPPSGANLFDLKNPDGWEYGYDGGTQIIFYPSNDGVFHNGNPTVRIDPHTSADSNTYRELDGAYIPVNQGDVIWMGVWAKTSPSATGVPYAAYFGFDLYGTKDSGGSGILHECSSDNPEQWTNPNYESITDPTANVFQANQDWAYKSFQITVPSHVGGGADYDAGTPTAIIPWVTGGSASQANSPIWFEGVELYRNP